MPKVLVTGGAGYIGCHVVRELQKTGFHVAVLDNNRQGREHLSVGTEFIYGDCELLPPRTLSGFDAVIHLAALASVADSWAYVAKYYQTNVTGSLNVLKESFLSQVKYFIFASSCAVYGYGSDGPMVEQTARHPISPYGRTKLMVEEMLLDFASAYGPKYAILRIFNAAGADPLGDIGENHHPETHLIPLALDVAAGLRPSAAVCGYSYKTADSTCVRDYVHVSDIARAHVLALQYLMEGGESLPFNLGTGRGYSVLEVLECVSAVTRAPIKLDYSDRRPGDPPILIADARRAKSVLGWEPEFPKLDQIVATAWNFHQKRREKCQTQHPMK